MSGEQWTWQPVEELQLTHDVTLHVDGAEVHLYHDSGVDLVFMMPDDLRLCRPAPGQQQEADS